MATTFDSQGLGGFDPGFMDQVNAELTAWTSTPEGQQWMKDMGYDTMFGGETVTPPEPPLGPSGDNGEGPSGGGSVVTDPWGRTPDNPNYGVDMEAKRQDARVSIKALLAKYKLDSLFDTVWGNYTSDMVDYTDTDALAMSIRETDAYKQRFAGNEARRSKGLGDLSPSTYIALEDSFKQTMRSNGIPDKFYDDPADFAQLIANDVSVGEFNDRIEYARSLVQDAPASVRNEMSRLFSVSEGQLIAYFIDPEKALPILKEQERSARIAAAAVENAGMQLTVDMAGDLAKRGFTEAEAQKGFGNISRLGELTQQFAGETAISQQDVIASQFGFNTEAEKEIKKRQARRVGEFKGGGSFAKSAGDVSGSVVTGVGKAQ